MKKRIYTLLASGLLLASVSGSIAACGGSQSKDSGDYLSETTAAAQYVQETAAAPGDAPGAASGAADTSAPNSGLTSATAIQPVTAARKLIRTVDLSVETTDFDSLLDMLTRTVTEMGGYIEQSDISGSSISDAQGSRRYASLTARIPSDKLDTFISQVDENGNITNKSENTQDVTLQYSDIESRKKTLSVEQDRLWELLAKADSMDAVIALESRLSEIRYQLESMESQLRTYDNQVDYCTVYLNLDEVRVFTPTTPDSVITRIQKGFSRNLESVGNGAVNFFIWLISSLPVILVVAIFAFVIISILRLVPHRKIKKQRLPSTPPVQPPVKEPSKTEKKTDAGEQNQQ